jgi:hypothetical protein
VKKSSDERVGKIVSMLWSVVIYVDKRSDEYGEVGRYG